MVSEQWKLFATIEGHGKRELLDSGTFNAVFYNPSVVFDKKELKFKVDLGPESSSCHLYGTFRP